MVVFAHPDDAEIYAGGTIARLTTDGKTVRSVKMTSGGKGSKQEKISEEDLKKLRRSEDTKAMEILGIKSEDNVYLEIGDGQVENDLDTIAKLVYQIRQFKPDLIMTHNPENVIIRFDESEGWVNHRDHRNTGKSTIDAAYPYSRDLNFFPEQFADEGIESHSVTEFLIVDSFGHPDLINIDVTETLDKKVQSIAAHSSQYSLKAAKESAAFFTDDPSGSNFEKFRRVVTD